MTPGHGRLSCRLLKLKTAFMLFGLAAADQIAPAQSADWQEVVWRGPQVRYLLADMTLNGGRTDLYRKYAKEERDPDSIEAVRRTEEGYRITNVGEFERRKVARRTLIARKASDERISGMEVKLSSDSWP